MIQRAAAVVVLLLCWILPSNADWYELNLSESGVSSTNPQVTFDGLDGLHVVWQEGPDIVHRYRSYNADTDEWDPPEVIGQGSNTEFVTCIPCYLMYFVWIAPDNTIRFRQWKFEIWQPEQTIPSAGIGEIKDVAVGKVGLGHVAWAEYDGATQDLVILYSYYENGWLPPIEVGRVVDTTDPDAAKVTAMRLDEAEKFVVSWLDNGTTPGVWAREYDGLLWQAPSNVLDTYSTFDADCSSTDETIHFAANGPQPSCPCNEVWYTSGAPGSWSTPVSIGTGRYPAEFEWPKDVAIHSRWSANIPYVVWRHESYDETQQPLDERLILAVNDGGGWVYDDQIAVNRNVHDPQVFTSSSDRGEVVVVWSDNHAGASDVYIATNAPASSVDWAPDIVRGLSVFPNPTREGAVIGLQLPGQHASRVEIFDVTGREIASFPGALSSSSEFRWNGRNSAGRLVPAGTYLVRAVLGDHELVRPFVVVH